MGAQSEGTYPHLAGGLEIFSSLRLKKRVEVRRQMGERRMSRKVQQAEGTASAKPETMAP